MCSHKALSLEFLPERLAVCKLKKLSDTPLNEELLFLCKTRDEISLVCREESVPVNALAAERGWRAFRVAETLKFSMTGVLAGIANTLAADEISLFAVSTYNTDYILIKEENAKKAALTLSESGYSIVNPK